MHTQNDIWEMQADLHTKPNGDPIPPKKYSLADVLRNGKKDMTYFLRKQE